MNNLNREFEAETQCAQLRRVVTRLENEKAEVESRRISLSFALDSMQAAEPIHQLCREVDRLERMLRESLNHCSVVDGVVEDIRNHPVKQIIMRGGGRSRIQQAEIDTWRFQMDFQEYLQHIKPPVNQMESAKELMRVRPDITGLELGNLLMKHGNELRRYAIALRERTVESSTSS